MLPRVPSEECFWNLVFLLNKNRNIIIRKIRKVVDAPMVGASVSLLPLLKSELKCESNFQTH